MIERFNNLADTSYLSELDLQTLAEDKQYEAEILRRRPTTFFRPGDRTSPTHETFFRADSRGISYIGFIDEYGSHAAKQPARFLPNRIAVRVNTREAKKVAEITQEECAGAYEDLATPESILRWLQKKYPDAQLTPDSVITVYKIDYIQKNTKPPA